MAGKSLHIGIVGCGVAGLATATILGRAGHRVRLIERAPILRPVGAGLLLQPSGQLALARLGLLDKVIADAEPIDGLHARTHRGGTLAKLYYKRLRGHHVGYGVHRNDLFQVLYTEAVTAGVDFRLGTTITACRQSASEISAVDSAGDEHGPFDVLIAADGGRSALRNTPGLGAAVRESKVGAAWFSGRCDAVRGRLHQVARGTKQLVGMLPLGRGRCSFFCAMPRGGKEAARRRGLQSIKREVATFCPESVGLLDQIMSIDDLTFVTYPRAGLRRWTVGRLACIGDAAHATTPHLGQGVNLALLDALAVGTALDAGDVTGSLARATEFRRRQTAWAWTLSNLLGPTFQSEGWVLGVARDLALPWLPRLPWVGTLMVGTMAGICVGPLGKLRIDNG